MFQLMLNRVRFTTMLNGGWALPDLSAPED